MNTIVQRVRQYYLPGFRAKCAPTPDMLRKWFKGGDVVDREISEQFRADVERSARGEYEELNREPAGVLTNLILLDQFPRNMYRGKAEQFQYDGKALALAKRAVAEGVDQKLDAIERLFVYLPFEHSERLEDQRESLRLFSALRDSVEEPQKEFGEQLVSFAVKHLEPIEKWGRFPHRNEMLGRESSAEELEYLAAGGGFGKGK